jgi:outer membrane assembly lipoprotein YfiO
VGETADVDERQGSVTERGSAASERSVPGRALRCARGAGRRLAWMAVVLGAAACARFNPQAFRDSESLYEASLRAFRRGTFDHAQVGFQKLTFDLTSRDSLFTPARFFLAETYFAQRDFVTAAREFRRVADESPESPLAPTALLRAGDANEQLWRRPQLDPASGQTALATWQELQGRYPDSPAAAMSYGRIRALNDLFARKEYETGLFYFRRGGFDSAILYFRNLIATYPSSTLVPESFILLVRSYRAIGYREEDQETCAHLLQYYPTRIDVRELCGNRTVRR